MLEKLAARLRHDAPDPTVVDVGPDEDGPALGALDVFSDESAITVTAETRNADAASVHVSLLDGRLLINLGEGPRAFRRDLALPAPVDEDAAVATFRNGVLDVVLPLKGKVRE